MSYHVMRSVDGRPYITLQGEPPYCKPLEPAPPVREPELSSGLWLIMAFAAWSKPEIDAVQVALDTARRFGGTLTLGLRPFDDPEKLDAWCPGLGKDVKSPMWVLLDNGEVRLELRGMFTTEALVSAIEATGLAQADEGP